MAHTEPPAGTAVDTTWIDGQVGYLLRRASAVMAADAAAAGGPLRPVLVTLLSVIDANPGIGQTAIGNALGIRRANVVPLVGELVDLGLVARRPSATDGRRVELRLTDDGQAAWRRGQAAIEDHEVHATSGISPDERATLLDLLGRIAATPPRAERHDD